MFRYFFLLVFFVPFFSLAQESAVRKAQNNFDDAQPYLRQNNFEQAIKYLDIAVKADPKFKTAYLQLGNIYRQKKTYDKAKENYELALASGIKPDAKINYSLGETELLTGDYQNAKINLTTFLKNYTGTDTLAIKKAKNYVSDCDFSILAIKNPVPYQPINMGFNINSANRDYFPTLTADLQTIIYSRVTNGNEDFFTSTKEGKDWTAAKPLIANINTPNYNEGAQSLSPDGKYLFFTGCNRPDGLGRCDIFVSRKEGKYWEKPYNLGPKVNSKNWESQPSISPGGNTLYFVSNRPGGYGGNDIWKSTLDANNNWSTPVNLGPNINTAFDETTPFIHADNKTLYFASDGWPGFGNKDIFYSRIGSDGQFAKPVNLGYPINTFNEENGLTVTADGTLGLFSSNLTGGYGDVDIYEFNMPESAKPLPITYVKGIIKDKDTKKPIEASILAINLDDNTAVYNDYTSQGTGDFLTVMPIGHSYSFNVEADGYLFYSQHYKLTEDYTNKPFEIEILLEKIKAGSKVTLNNIFFEINKYELLPASRVELGILVDLLNTNKNLAIEIQGYTDDIGDLKSNQTLSENRAKAVYNYLINSKIESKRLSFKGYGESRPKAKNDTEEGRKQNRRTDFIVTKI